MSGHSKWHKIKHQKEATDKKKGLVFGKLAREIAIAARGEKDPAKNPTLREAIARAKKVNMPQENIDRLLSNSDKPLHSVTYEGFGPGGSALLISAETDNPNRTVNELRALLKEHGGHLANPGSVMWQFKRTQSEDGVRFAPTQPLILSGAEQTALTTFLEALHNHPDIVHVTTNVAEEALQ